MIHLMALLGVLASQSCPAVPLPAPTGPFAIGTTILPIERLHGTGTSRQVQLWYPAERAAGGEHAQYVPSPDILGALRSAQFLSQPECVFDLWHTMTLPAIMQAPVARGRFPFVMISPGAGMPRFSYSYLAEQLASDGYIVATIDYGEGGLLVQNGAVLNEGPDVKSESDYDGYAQNMASHLSEILDRLLAASPGGIAEHIDSARVAAVGHSLGGAASLDACRADRRITACVDMDGATQNPVGAEGIKTSALILMSHPDYTDAELVKKGRDPAKWKALGRQAQADMAKLVSAPGPDAWVVSIAKTGHLSFSDAPCTMQTTLTRFGGTYLAPRHTLELTARAIEGYLQHVFSRAPFLPGQLPEVTVVAIRPA